MKKTTEFELTLGVALFGTGITSVVSSSHIRCRHGELRAGDLLGWHDASGTRQVGSARFFLRAQFATEARFFVHMQQHRHVEGNNWAVDTNWSGNSVLIPVLIVKPLMGLSDGTSIRIRIPFRGCEGVPRMLMHVDACEGIPRMLMLAKVFLARVCDHLLAWVL